MSLVTNTDSAARDKIKEFYSSIEHVGTVDSLYPGGSFRVSIEDDSMSDLLIEFGPEKFRELTKEAIFQIIQQKRPGIDVAMVFEDLRIQIKDQSIISLQELGPKIQNTPVSFECVISAVDNRKTYIIETVLVCPNCNTEVNAKLNWENAIPQRNCTSSQCRGRIMAPDPKRTKTDYIQTIRIQEPLENARHNSPISFIAKVRGKNVGEIFMGQKKKILGMFKSVLDTKGQEKEINIEVIDSEDLEDVQLKIPNSDEIKILEDSVKKENDFLDKVIQSYAPDIYGFYNIKKSLLYQLAGGYGIGNKRGEINILLVGDPSMAKSQLLKFGKAITQKSIYTNGKGSSGAGLTIAMVKDEQIGKWMAMAGVYPLCNGGYAYIDEFDKMSREDRSAIHEVLEQGTCSIAKAGINQTLKAKVTTLAAANPKFGKYDPSLTLEENIDLPPTIMSRFDMIWLIRDKVQSIIDRKKAEHVLSEYTDGGKNWDIYMNKEELMAYINYTRTLKPRLTKATAKSLEDIYIKLREASEKNSTTPVGIRQLESMVRMCVGRAKLLLKTEVDEEDVADIMDLYKEMFKTFGVEFEQGEGQQQLFGTKDLNKEQMFWHAFHSCENDDKRVDFKKLKDMLQTYDKFWSTDEEAEKEIYRYHDSMQIMKDQGEYYKAS